MNTNVKLEFDSRELEVVYAALEQYRRYLSDYMSNFPVVVTHSFTNDNSLEDLSYCVLRVESLKEKVEEVIAHAKALKNVQCHT